MAHCCSVSVYLNWISELCFVGQKCIYCPHHLSSVTIFLTLSLSILLAPILMVFGSISGPALIFAPGKWLFKSIFWALMMSYLGPLLEVLMVIPLLSYRLQRFFSVWVVLDSYLQTQKLLQLLTLACLTAFLYSRWASRYDSQCAGTFWHWTILNFLLVLFLNFFSSLVHHTFPT